MRSPFPETRNSLILRLVDKRDIEAWELFASIYEPLVYRLARASGFQDADAREIVQEVLVTVSRAVERWQPDLDRGRFRDWLFRIARNLMIKFLTRRKHRPIGTGDSAIAELLLQQVDPACEESALEETALFDLEYRREIFRWAADQVRLQVKENTWQAFWLTSIEGRTTADVACELDMSIGAVHIARSRVRSRLRKAIEGLERNAESTNAASTDDARE
jgi:RNA polymerase sigma-70 factor (ECF subfamily)